MIVGQIARKRFEHLKRVAACVVIQKNARMFLKLKCYRAVYDLATRLQASIRGKAANNKYLSQKQTDAAVVLQVCYLKQVTACYAVYVNFYFIFYQLFAEYMPT